MRLLMVLWAAAAYTAAAADIKVIANPGVGAGAISAEELKAIFLVVKTTLNDGSHVEPVIAKGGAAHQTFLQTYVGKTAPALETYYRSLAFTGKGTMPKAGVSDADVIALVAKTKGAIGYVSASTSTAGVKVLEVK